jgi:hypothetical protein
VDVEHVNDTLVKRVEQVMQAYRGHEIRSTTGTQAAIEELAARNEALEEVVCELASELERLTARFERRMSQLDMRKSGYYSVTYPHD